jgi:hypothetical protein
MTLSALSMTHVYGRTSSDVGKSSMNSIILSVFGVGIVVSLLSWGLGLLRASQRNLIVGCGTFAVTSIFLVCVNPGSAPTFALGGGAILLGAETLVIGRFTSPRCPLQSGSRLAIGFLLVGLGLLLVLMI